MKKHQGLCTGSKVLKWKLEMREMGCKNEGDRIKRLIFIDNLGHKSLDAHEGWELKELDLSRRCIRTYLDFLQSNF